MSPNDVQVGSDLDRVDYELIALLRENARMPNNELATRVGIAPSTCLARMRSLVARGIITGFSANLNPAALGLQLQALISVSIRSGARNSISAFAQEMRGLPEVVQLFFLGGAEDFIIHVAVRDSNDVRDFVLEHLSTHHAVASTRTSIVFDHHLNGPTPAKRRELS